MENYKEEVITNSGFKDVPKWLNEQLFQEFLTKDFPTFRKILKFTVRPAVKAGENYMTIILRTTIQLELENSTPITTSYMVKIKPSPEKLQAMIKEWKIFIKEHNTYTNYIPAFEQYYREAGLNVQLAPRILVPTKSNINDDLLILEDLRLKGFRNANRHLGLDFEHTKAVLRKLAEFHAASAQYFVKEGPYPKMYEKCLMSEEDLFQDHRMQISEIFCEHLHLYGDFDYLRQKLKVCGEKLPDPFQTKSDWQSNKFNVLNHGDCWTNNIMFQYDEDSELKATLLIDFQMSRYGSPAQDLLYFLLSSTNLEVKLKHFDYFIYYYHKQLKECLHLIRYDGEIPTLKDIHVELLKHDYWAYTVISALMAIVLCESRDDANVDNLISDENDEFKRFMYTGDAYVKSMNLLLPWLDNRGAFDVMN